MHQYTFLLCINTAKDISSYSLKIISISCERRCPLSLSLALIQNIKHNASYTLVLIQLYLFVRPVSPTKEITLCRATYYFLLTFLTVKTTVPKFSAISNFLLEFFFWSFFKYYIISVRFLPLYLLSQGWQCTQCPQPLALTCFPPNEVLWF